MPFESPALRERETVCGHPGSDCRDHGDPAGLCVHGDGARDRGECAGAAPCSLSASAERYRCCSCIGHTKVACTCSHERPPYTHGVVETDGTRVSTQAWEVRFQSQQKGTSPDVSVGLFRTEYLHQFCVLKTEEETIHAPQGNKKAVLCIAPMEGTRRQVGREAKGLFGIRSFVPLIFRTM